MISNVEHFLIKRKINIKLPGKQNNWKQRPWKYIIGLFAETQRPRWLNRSELFSFSKDLRCFHYPRKVKSIQQVVCSPICQLFTSIKLALCKFIWMHNAFFVCADNDFTLGFLDTVRNGRREDSCRYSWSLFTFWRLREGGWTEERANVRSLIQWKNFKIPAAQLYPSKLYDTVPANVVLELHKQTLQVQMLIFLDKSFMHLFYFNIK